MNTTNTQLCFTVYHEAWYWKTAGLPNVVYEIGVHRQYVEPDADAGCIEWEFTLRWETYGSEVRPRPHLGVQIFDDAFEAFADVPQLFTELAKVGVNAGEPSPEPHVIEEILMTLGFEDITPREWP
jgi:hypothetical protein